MPTLLTEARLKEAVNSASLIEHGEINSVEGIKIDLHVGDLLLKAQYTQPIKIGDLSTLEKSGLHIAPSEVVFVMTREVLHLPKNILATLTPKRTFAHGGIIVLGGLAVDPGYWGPLWLGLYNASSMNFPLSEGQKLISAILYELSGKELSGLNIEVMTQPKLEFPPELVSMISKYKPVELKAIQDNLESLKIELATLRSEIANDNRWKDDFKKLLEANNSQISDISRLLKSETQERTDSEKEIRAQLSAVNNNFSGLKNWRSATIAVIALAIGAFFTWFIPKLLDHPTPQSQPTYSIPPGYTLQPVAPPVQNTQIPNPSSLSATKK